MTDINKSQPYRLLAGENLKAQIKHEGVIQSNDDDPETLSPKEEQEIIQSLIAADKLPPMDQWAKENYKIKVGKKTYSLSDVYDQTTVLRPTERSWFGLGGQYLQIGQHDGYGFHALYRTTFANPWLRHMLGVTAKVGGIRTTNENTDNPDFPYQTYVSGFEVGGSVFLDTPLWSSHDGLFQVDLSPSVGLNLGLLSIPGEEEKGYKSVSFNCPTHLKPQACPAEGAEVELKEPTGQYGLANGQGSAFPAHGGLLIRPEANLDLNIHAHVPLYFIKGFLIQPGIGVTNTIVNPNVGISQSDWGFNAHLNILAKWDEGDVSDYPGVRRSAESLIEIDPTVTSTGTEMPTEKAAADPSQLPWKDLIQLTEAGDKKTLVIKGDPKLTGKATLVLAFVPEDTKKGVMQQFKVEVDLATGASLTLPEDTHFLNHDEFSDDARGVFVVESVAGEDGNSKSLTGASLMQIEFKRFKVASSETTVKEPAKTEPAIAASEKPVSVKTEPVKTEPAAKKPVEPAAADPKVETPKEEPAAKPAATDLFAGKKHIREFIAAGNEEGSIDNEDGSGFKPKVGNKEFVSRYKKTVFWSMTPKQAERFAKLASGELGGTFTALADKNAKGPNKPAIKDYSYKKGVLEYTQITYPEGIDPQDIKFTLNSKSWGDALNGFEVASTLNTEVRDQYINKGLTLFDECKTRISVKPTEYANPETGELLWEIVYTTYSVSNMASIPALEKGEIPPSKITQVTHGDIDKFLQVNYEVTKKGA